MTALQPGEAVGRYVVEARIGLGGLAEVYRVKHQELGSLHALKVLSGRHPALTRRLRTEGRIQASLDHPAIVRVTDMIEVDGRAALVMELVDGETLARLIARVGPLSVSDTLQLMAPIFSAILTAHSAGVVHRDLKPANILMAPAPAGGLRPMVTDFGIARLLDVDGHTRVGATMGSPGYLAPEQLADASSADERADVWALGILLYEVLTGRLAFPGRDVSVPPVPIEALRADCPPALAAAVRDAMQPDREQRIGSCRALADQVFAAHPRLHAIATRPPSASLPEFTTAGMTLAPAAPTVVVAPERKRWGAAIGAIVGVAAAVLAGWWVWPAPSVEEAAVVPLQAVIEEAPPVPEAVTVEKAVPQTAPNPAAGVDVEATVEVVEEAAVRVVAAAEEAAVEEEAVEEEAVEAHVAEDATEEEAAAETIVVEEVIALPPEEAAPPVISGRWRGELDGRRLLLEIRGQHRLSATATLTMGTSQRTISLTGSLDGDVLTLTDAATGLQLHATVDGDAITGWSTRRSGRKRSAWSAQRMQ